MNLCMTAGKDWLKDGCPKLAASISFYTIFALAPLLLILVAVLGWLFGNDVAQGHISSQLHALMGKQGEDVFVSVTQSARDSDKGMLATIFGAIVLLIAASGVFGELKDALNRVWDIETRPGFSVRRLVRERVLSFAMVFVVAFLLIVSLAISTALAAFGTWAESSLPAPASVLMVANTVVSFLVITTLFALIFKFLPDAKIAWREVWLGAVITSLLFSLGKFLIALYLGHTSLASSYGAAGSLVMVLIWVYYSALIFLYGAELTQAHAKLSGREVLPAANARRAGEAEERRATGP